MSGRTILHVDMDAFFVEVERRRDPSLVGVPVVVGGTGGRGVVASASYEARAVGVRSAMPTAHARRRCPQARYLAPDHGAYREASEQVMAVLRSVTPLVEPLALDEAFLDVTGARRLLGEGPALGASIRARLRDELGLPASVGVAPSKLLAKLASEAAKPRAAPDGTRPGAGVVVVAPGEELGFLHPLPAAVVPGVGPATAARLARLGVETVGDLARVPVGALVGALGSSAGRSLHELAWARDARPVQPDRPPVSIGHEETFAEDVDDRDALAAKVVALADSVGSRLRAAAVGARTVTLKVRYGDFRTVTRSLTLPDATDDGRQLARAGRELLGRVEPGAVRLLGLSGSRLVAGAPEQLTLDQATPMGPERARVGPVVDAIRERFGTSALGLAVSSAAPDRYPDERHSPPGPPPPGTPRWSRGGPA